jgi:hypothetical protein
MNIDKLQFRYFDERTNSMIYKSSDENIDDYFISAYRHAKNNDLMLSYGNYKDRKRNLIYEGDILGTYSTKNQVCDLDMWSIKYYGTTELKLNKNNIFYFSNWNPEFGINYESSVYYKKYIVILGNKYEGIKREYKELV